ncbi:hypothetical protein IWW55_003974, partial [Coemansia sp. RSA 2706]
VYASPTLTARWRNMPCNLLSRASFAIGSFRTRARACPTLVQARNTRTPGQKLFNLSRNQPRKRPRTMTSSCIQTWRASC